MGHITSLPLICYYETVLHDFNGKMTRRITLGSSRRLGHISTLATAETSALPSCRGTGSAVPQASGAVPPWPEGTILEMVHSDEAAFLLCPKKAVL